MRPKGLCTRPKVYKPRNQVRHENECCRVGGIYIWVPHPEITWDLRVNGGLYRGPPPRDNAGLKG